MNLFHRRLCRSRLWKTAVEKYILPWALEDVDLGSDILEIGPGPGATTEFLCDRAGRLTCIEIDSAYAASLARRMAGRNVTVLCEDATNMSLAGGAFDGAVSLSMLHHVSSERLQDKLFAEVARVLRPGGAFAGFDHIQSPGLRLVHLFDTMVLVNPQTLPLRLETAGFTDIHIDINRYGFRFRARRPLTS